MELKLIAALCAVSCAFAQTGVWESLADYPIEAFEVSTTVLQGKVFAACGLTAAGAVNRAFLYDPLIDTWAETVPLPLLNGGDHCNLAAANGKLYLLGALVRAQGPALADGSTFEFDPAKGEWTRIAEMPTPRGASGVAVIGNKIYVAGGISGNTNYAAMEVFDVVTREWTRLPDMPTRRDHLVAQAVGGKVYAIAGHPGRGQNTSANEEYDPATMTWRFRAPIPTPGGGMTGGVFANRFVIAGGGEGFAGNVEYDPTTDQWRDLEPLAAPRNGWYGTGAVLDGRLFLPAGGPTPGTSYSRKHTMFIYPLERPPRIGGMRNAKDSVAPFAPGDTVLFWGEDLSSGERLGQEVLINGVSATYEGVPLTLSYVSQRFIVLSLPKDLPPPPAQVIVKTAGVASRPFEIR